MEVPSDIMSRYLERRKRDLEACMASLEQKNFRQLEKVGHQLKGNGVTFGHPELSHIGSKLENAAAVHDHYSAEKVLKEFSFWISDRAS